MSIIDKALEANRNYAKNFNPTLGKRPAPKIAVVTCMDPRLSDPPGILGLPQADLDVIRTGGPAVTEDVSQSSLFPIEYSEPQKSVEKTDLIVSGTHSYFAPEVCPRDRHSSPVA